MWMVYVQDAKNITISGFCFTLDAQVIGAAKGGNDDIVFEYNLFDNEITTASGYPDGGEVMMFPTTGNYNKNFTVRYNRFLSTGGKTYHLMISYNMRFFKDYRFLHHAL